VAKGETATVTVTLSFTSTLAYESLTVLVNRQGSGFTEQIRGLTTDSINVRTGLTNVGAFQVLTNAANTPISMSAATDSMHVSSSTNGTQPTLVQAKYNFDVKVGTDASVGTYYYTLSLVKLLPDTTGATAKYDLLDTDNLTLTVTALDTTAIASKSQLYINQALCATAVCNGLLNGNGNANSRAYAIEADSALVVSAGAPSTGGTVTYAEVGYMFGVFRNASDTVTVLGDSVTATMTVSIVGPGALSKRTDSTKVKSLTISNSSDTITVWSDGTAGTATITGYIGTTALTQAAKTVVFTGKSATITATETSVTKTNGGIALSSTAADSITVGTNLVTFTAKDSAGNAMTSLAQEKNATLYCISSDTSVVGAQGASIGVTPSTLNYIAARTTNTAGTWGCPMVIRKAGTATITIADESVVANSRVSSSAVSLTFASSVNSTTKGIGTITFDKASYNVGEKANITVTVLNASKVAPGQANVAGDAYSTANVFPTLIQSSPFSGIGYDASGNALGFGSGRTGTSVSLTGSTFIAGVETFVVLMPTTPGTFTITGYTTDGTNDTATALNVSIKVVDPLEAVIKTQVDAAKAEAAAATAAADAATDAALQAIDAANAATDAANLAAEAADAATVAAEEAKDAADAATAAVEALATQVATLMAALQAQIRSLANTVAKIAKKVKA
jgi:hypothetical protein